MLFLINSCNKRGNLFTSNMSFRMSSDDTVTCVSGEGSGPSPGEIAGHTNADQTSEGHSLKTGGDSWFSSNRKRHKMQIRR